MRPIGDPRVDDYLMEHVLPVATTIQNKHNFMMERDLTKAVRAEMSFNRVVDGVEQHFSYSVWLGSTYGILTSDFGHLLYKTPFSDGSLPDFAVVWSYNIKSDNWKYSLRAGARGETTADEAVDVSQICTDFGGGGHKAAAGFELPDGSGQPRNLFILSE